ncbi:MAG: carbohydrate ABC transporter permease [Fimbriimonadales bacterium]
MTANLLYVLGTLAFWSGAFLLLRAVYSKPSRIPDAIAAGILLLGAAATPAYRGGLAIPLVWLVIPFSGWAAVACFAVTVVWSARATLEGSRTRLPAVLVSLLAGLCFLWLFRADPSNGIEVIRGRIGLSPASAFGLAAFLIAAISLIARVGRRGKSAAIHAALLAGCVIFGLPFAWLLITSFKEERDMTSANGLVWIPKVQQTVDYYDPEDQLLEGRHQGQTVQGSQIGRASDGSPIVEIQRPSSLRGISFNSPLGSLKVVPKAAPVVSGSGFTGFVVKELDDGSRVVRFLTPPSLKGRQQTFLPSQLEPVRNVGLRLQNYSDALDAMPPETRRGLVYLKNTLIIVILSVVGTLLSSSLVAFGFSRIRFPGREVLFKVLLATMMLPGAVTLMPQFLFFRSLGWIDTLYPLWVPAFFASAFNVFLLRQFFSQIPTELEDAGKIDGASVLRVFWGIMLPQIKPALAVVAIWTFMGAWNNFLGPLIYVNTPENMPLSYALQLFQSERGGEPGVMMAFATMTIIPVVALFFFAQRYFIEGVTLSGLGGR